MNKFNVIIYDFNRRKFTTYDVMPYLREAYKERSDRYKKLVKDSKRLKNLLLVIHLIRKGNKT